MPEVLLDKGLYFTVVLVDLFGHHFLGDLLRVERVAEPGVKEALEDIVLSRPLWLHRRHFGACAVIPTLRSDALRISRF